MPGHAFCDVAKVGQKAVVGFVYLPDVVQKAFEGFPLAVLVEQGGEGFVELVEGLDAGEDVVGVLEVAAVIFVCWNVESSTEAWVVMKSCASSEARMLMSRFAPSCLKRANIMRSNFFRSCSSCSPLRGVNSVSVSLPSMNHDPLRHLLLRHRLRGWAVCCAAGSRLT